MIQDHIDLDTSVQVQSQDPIGVIAGQVATGDRPQCDVAPQSSFEIAWALAH
jgi:hypothetical protein